MGMTAADYKAMLQALLPRGAAWPRDDDAVLTQLLDALAQEFARFDVRVDTLIRELDPRRTEELLMDWEGLAGLPGACGELAPTLQERRNALVGHLTARGSQSRQFYIDLAARLGYAITISEYHPFRAGFSSPGDGLTNETWVFRWMVHGPETEIFPFSAGQSSAGEPVASWGDERLECPITHLKPAHTEVSFSYGG